MSGHDSAGVEIRVHRDDSEDLPRLSSIRIEAVHDLTGHVLASEGRSGGEVDIVFCGDRRITELNREWLDRDGPTDVIAFDLSEGDDPTVVEGEVYIDIAQAERQAPEFGATLEEEVRRLVVHGVLHLVGYTDTGTPGEADKMNKRQEEFVAGWKIPVLEGEE